MILRKPYAFLIKHFKLIHLVMTLLMGILVYQTNLLLEFFNDFVGSSQIIIGTEIVTSLFNNYAYICAGLVILIAAIVFILMTFKEKPRTYYVLTIIGYILLIVLYAYSVSTINEMQVGLVDERITRAIRDFLNMIFIFQIYTVFISLIRSIGLDVKKFEFGQDVEELNITDQDNEEFEVNIEFDSHTLKRKIRRNYRNLRYYFIENKLIFTLIIIITVLLGGFLIFRSLRSNTEIYGVGQHFSPINYNVTIGDSYITSNDYRLKKITSEDKSLVVVKFNIRTLNKTTNFVYGKLALQIGDDKYYHTNKYSSMLTDIGTTYIKQSLTDEFQEYMLVYEIPAEVKNDSMTLVYTEQIVKGLFNDKTDDIKIKINPVDLDVENIEENISIRQNYIVGTGLLKNHELKVNDFEFDSSFKINYNSCVKTNECYQFYEIVKPTLSGISDKGVLRINMDLIVPDNSKITVKSLIAQFGSIKYEINGVKKVSSIGKMLDITHKDGNYYFEIKKEILGAEKISLVIATRNDVYNFILK